MTNWGVCRSSQTWRLIFLLIAVIETETLSKQRYEVNEFNTAVAFLPVSIFLLWICSDVFFGKRVPGNFEALDYSVTVSFIVYLTNTVHFLFVFCVIFCVDVCSVFWSYEWRKYSEQNIFPPDWCSDEYERSCNVCKTEGNTKTGNLLYRICSF